MAVSSPVPGVPSGSVIVVVTVTEPFGGVPPTVLVSLAPWVVLVASIFVVHVGGNVVRALHKQTEVVAGHEDRTGDRRRSG